METKKKPSPVIDPLSTWRALNEHLLTADESACEGLLKRAKAKRMSGIFIKRIEARFRRARNLREKAQV